MRRKIFAAVVAVLFTYLLTPTASAHYHFDHDHGWMGGGGWFGFAIMLLWTVLLAALIVALVYWLRKGMRDATEKDEAMKTLRERYARGEIDEEEFRSRRRHLKENGSGVGEYRSGEGEG